MWKTKLITLYCTVCQCYDSKLRATVQRLSNNDRPQFTDEEVITVFLWGILQRLFEVKAIYSFTKEYLHKWFPRLPSYQAFSRRLNELSPAFAGLIEIFMDELGNSPLSHAFVIDSFPIILAKQSRSSRAKVAGEFCDKTYCASRREWYYGAKLHAIGRVQTGTLPACEAFRLTAASENDLTVAKQLFDEGKPIRDGYLYADKAYIDAAWRERLKAVSNIILCTPRKKAKGIIEFFPGPDIASTIVSSIRQPIESFFHWLNEKTHIQVASKVRSCKGLFLHVLGRFAAALASLCLGF